MMSDETRLGEREQAGDTSPESAGNDGPLEIIAYTDGACSGNPGPGGWGVLLQAWRGGELVKERELKGGEPETTNNRMELMAAIKALEALERPSRITIVTDSAYLKGGITEWMNKWERNGWRTSGKKPVKNEDLWRRLKELVLRHEVHWRWVKGHDGHPENERADKLAREGMAPYKKAVSAKREES